VTLPGALATPRAQSLVQAAVSVEHVLPRHVVHVLEGTDPPQRGSLMQSAAQLPDGVVASHAQAMKAA
jgi:hypothetical protein